MRRHTFADQIWFPPGTIDRRTKIHKALDKAMRDKWITVTNMNGSFGGPYLGHKHIRRTGTTLLIYMCTESISAAGAHNPNKFVKMLCTDFDLNNYIKVEQREGADAQKQARFGTTNLDTIQSMLKWTDMSCFA